MAAGAIKLVRTLDPDTPALLSLDQPWSEHMGRREADFPPLHFADALVRAGLELQGLVLEVNLGYRSRLYAAARAAGIQPSIGLLERVGPAALRGDKRAQRRRATIRSRGRRVRCRREVGRRRVSRPGSPATCR